jgi:predicted PurR-regulated permease PerM
MLLMMACVFSLGWILSAFYSAILWGLILAMLLTPLYRRLLVLVHHRPNLASAIAMFLLIVGGVVPFALITAALAREASDIYRLIDTGEWKPAALMHTIFDSLPGWLVSLLHYLGIANVEVLLRRIDTAASQGSQFIATQALSIGLNTFDFASSLCIALYLGFFLLRDGDRLSKSSWRALPLGLRQKEELCARFTAVIRATIKGSLMIAAIQGTLGGLAFLYLGVKGALLWGILMAIASLMPVVGTALIWSPVAAYFFVTGESWKAIQLVMYGVAVIGLIDNLLRPILVGRDARLPDYVVMITTLGGMAAFGVNGFVIGPAIAAMFIAVWHMCTIPEPA